MSLFVVTQTVVPPAGVGETGPHARGLLDDNERPLTDAGLDQRVEFGTTVVLDGRGSNDPDGSITAYEWRIETPTGAIHSPACATCAETQFRPNQTGRYTVTLTTTDDDGATSTDSLFVTVTAGSGPSVSLSGTDTTTVGTPTTVLASVSAGDGSLDRIEWFVDGTSVGTRPAAAPDSNRLRPAFPLAGTHVVRAVVYDEVGRTAAATHSIVVSTPTPPPNGTPPNGSVPPGGTPPSPPSGPGNGSASLASIYAPTVSGPRVVTGEAPLAATYSLDGLPPASDLHGLTWFDAATARGTAQTLSVEWEPGDRQLFAVVEYRDGSTDIATFTDGSTRVVADPKPDVSLSNLDNANHVAGDIVATDDYANLLRVTVTVDGEIQLKKDGSMRGRNPTLGDHVASSFSFEDIDPNESHTVTITVVDGRNQRTTITREVEPVGEIEVVRAGFVNGPVDSMHRRIDPSRYIAHHVVEVELNGNDAEDITASYFNPREQLKRLDPIIHAGTEVVDNDTKVLLHSYWAGTRADDYTIRHKISRGGWRNTTVTGESTLDVEPSDPELVLTTEITGTEPAERDWGIIVDASRSFDPDHTQLKFDWTKGANARDGQSGIGKFSSRKMGGLIVTDHNGGRSSQMCCFLQYFAPQIRDIEETTEGPYNDTDTVRFNVTSDWYAFTKVSSEYSIPLSYESESPAVKIVRQGVRMDYPDDVPQDSTSNRLRRYVGIIEIKAKALNGPDKQPVLWLVNQENPSRIRNGMTLSGVEINNSEQKRVFRTNATINSIVYQVRNQNGEDSVTVDSHQEVQRYLQNDYTVSKEGKEITGIQLEELVEVTEQVSETREFDSIEDRKAFVMASTKWQADGREITKTTELDTQFEWRNGVWGHGNYTGKTRIVAVPAQRQTIYQYLYRVQRSSSKTITVKKPITVAKNVTKERRERVCNGLVGCYVRTVEYETTVEVTVMKEVTKQVTDTYWDTEKYWAEMPRSPGHRATGKQDEVIVTPASENKQYQYEIERKVTESNTVFFATKTVERVVPEWRDYLLVSDPIRANELANMNGVRIGQTSAEKYWVMTKPATTTEMVYEYESKDNVIRTIAFVSGDEKIERFGQESEGLVVEDAGTFVEEMSREGAISENEFLSIIRKYYINSECGDRDDC
ncbi:PKD domain-containing protein [Haloarchaeobius sp. DFWS5]|uniref:PKD domain-containing protein n=1 Tax=Haloarchaeobius sp. DFWS5 TaxID=3446114 RepID=UPI003EB9F193